MPIYNYVCNKIYLRSVFDGITFPEGYVFEDMAIVYCIIDRANTIFVSNAVLYNYVQRVGSITSSYNQTSSINDRFEIWLKMLPFLKKHYYKAYVVVLKITVDQAIDIIAHFYKSLMLTKKQSLSYANIEKI